MPIQAQIQGSESLQRKLQAMTEAVRGQMLERALVAGGLVIVNAAKEIAPYRTGNLRRSIHVGGHAGESGGLINTTGGEVSPPVVTPDRVEIYVGTNVEYAAQREYGGTIVPVNAPMLSWQDADGTRHFAHSVTQEATPYLRPAVDENTEAVQREVGEALRDLLRAAL